MITACYSANITHLLDEFERINVLISANLLHIFAEKNEPQLVESSLPANSVSLKRSNIDSAIATATSSSTQEIDTMSINNQPFGIPLWATKKSNSSELKEKMATLRYNIDTKICNSPNSTKDLRLLKLKQVFALSPEELDILLICLIGEFDPHYHDLWRDLQNDIDKIYPCVDIIQNLLSSNLMEKLKLKKYFHNESNLFKFNLLECVDTGSYAADFTSYHKVKVSPRVLHYLLGDDSIPPIVSDVLEFISPTKVLNELYLPVNLYDQIQSFVKNYQVLVASKYCSIITLRGKEGVGREMVAESICQMLGMNLLIVNIDHLLSSQLSGLSYLLSLIRREAVLQNAAICWKNIRLLSTNDKSNILSLFNKSLKEFTGIHFFILNSYEYFPFYRIKSTLMHLEVPNLTASERFNLWQSLVPTLSLENTMEITQSFQLGRGQIYDIVTHTQSLFKNNQDKLSKEEIYQICHTHAHHHLSTFAKIIKPLYTLENIILPQECNQELREIIAWTKYKGIVYERSGFEQKVSLGKGLIALFFGPPGTGKTMAAEVIAHSMNLLLYKIDLSAVLSKYVGETEQHLDKIFNEAENSNAILFFDEADSLFGKRGEVKDARDNYANIQTSYLLQKVEEYPGIIILATNYKNNMDEAFIRRLHFSVDFPLPQPDQRYTMWQQIWPQDILLDTEIDLHKLADKLDITGGNIRNIALTATFKAVSELHIQEGPITITKAQLIFAIKQEFKKMGRIIIYEQLNKLFDTKL